MLGWCIVTLASARLKASVRFPPLRGMYQRGGTCKGCDKPSLTDRIIETKRMTNSRKAISDRNATRLRIHQRTLETLSGKCTSVVRGRRIREFIP